MLDVLTPRGQITVQQERLAREIFSRHYPRFEMAWTPKDQPADIDGFLIDRGQICAGIEVKCRQMTLRQLEKEFGWKWLLTFDKLLRARLCAISHRVPLVGWLLLVPDRVLLTQRLFNPDGTLVVPIEVATTVTQKTVNGGLATRANAFIPMSAAKQLR